MRVRNQKDSSASGGNTQIIACAKIEVYTCIRADDCKDVLGLWIEQTEGTKFWLKVFNRLKNRGLDDILIAVVDGLRAFSEAIKPM